MDVMRRSIKLPALDLNRSTFFPPPQVLRRSSMPHMSFAARGSMRGVLATPNRRNQFDSLLARDLQRKNKFSEGDFECVQCQRRFPTLERLREHFRGAKLIHPACPACGRGCADQIELDEHKRMDHPDISLCMIVDCTRAGHDHRALMRHVYSDHSQRVECRFCHNWYHDKDHLHCKSHKPGCPNNRLDAALSQESAQLFEALLSATTKRASKEASASIIPRSQQITKDGTRRPTVHREALAPAAFNNTNNSLRRHAMLSAPTSAVESSYHRMSSNTVPPSAFNPQAEHPRAVTEYYVAPMNSSQPFVNTGTNGNESMLGWTDAHIPGPPLGDEASIYRGAQHDEEWTLLQTPDATLPNQDDGGNKASESSRHQHGTDKPDIFITPPDDDEDFARVSEVTDSCPPIDENRSPSESLLSAESRPLRAEGKLSAAVSGLGSHLYSKSQTVSPTGTPLLKPTASLSVDSSPAAIRMRELWDEIMQLAGLSRNATPLTTRAATPDQPLYPDNAPYPLLNDRSAERNNPCGQDTLASTHNLRNAHDTRSEGISPPEVYHGPWLFGQNPVGRLMCVVCNGLVGPFSQISGETFCGRCCRNELTKSRRDSQVTV